MQPTAFPTTTKQVGQAVIYVRVSTEEQVENYSLDTQLEICRKEAEKRKMQVIQVFREEGRSAKTADRPELIHLLEYCRKNKRLVDAVVVYRLDRISRQTSDYLAIRKKLSECDIELISASEPTGNSPTEKFVETMLAGFAQMDNDIRSERTRNGMKARFLSGLISNVAPLGYLNQNGYVVKDPETWDIMKAAWDLMGTGTKPLSEMAEILNKQGVRIKGHSNRTTPVSAKALSRIFRNKFYYGILSSKAYAQEVRGQHTPMITEELFYRVQSITLGRNNSKAVQVAKKNPNNPNFPLRRIVKCSTCGWSFTGGFSRNRHKKRFGYYFCPKRCVKGPGSSVPMKRMEDEMKQLLAAITLKPEAIKLVIYLFQKNYKERAGDLIKKRDEADVELEKLYDLRQTLVEKNMSGIYSDEIFKEQNKRIEEKIKLTQMAKSDSVLERYNLEKICNFIVNKFTNLAQTYDESRLEQIRVLLCSIFPAGVQWAYPGYSNPEIHQIYTCCQRFSSADVTFGGP